MPRGRLEEARAALLALVPAGFEEVDGGSEVELAAYTDAAGEELLRDAFGAVAAETVAEDWAERWRAFHRSVRVGPLWVGPPWEVAPPGATAVAIEPGRAFGTGAHATTRLCLELLLDLPRGPLHDLGCGSGVLAVAAARLGFGPVTALDSDPAAVEAARSNARRNGVELEVRQCDVLAEPLPATAVTVANIELTTVEAVAARVETDLLVVSGYLTGERPRLARFQPVRRRELEGWAADLARRR